MNCGCWHITWSVFHGGDLGSIAFHTGIFCADFDLQIVIEKSMDPIIFKIQTVND